MHMFVAELSDGMLKPSTNIYAATGAVRHTANRPKRQVDGLGGLDLSGTRFRERRLYLSSYTGQSLVAAKYALVQSDRLHE